MREIPHFVRRSRQFRMWDLSIDQLLKESRAYRRNGEYSSALDYTKHARKQEPGCPEVAYEHALNVVANRYYHSAAIFCEKRVDWVNPVYDEKFIRLFFYATNMDHETKKFDKERKEMRRAIHEENVKKAEERRQLESARRAIRQSEQARRFYEDSVFPRVGRKSKPRFTTPSTRKPGPSHCGGRHTTHERR